MDNWGTVAISMLGSAGLVSLLLWLTKSWIGERLKNAIKSEYDLKLEVHKSQLKAHSDLELEKLKAALSIQAAEQNLTFARLHDRRIEVIADTFIRLKLLQSRAWKYLSIWEDDNIHERDAKREAVAEALIDCSQYFDTKSIFLPKHVSALVGVVLREIQGTTDGLTYSRQFRNDPNREAQHALFTRFTTECAAAISALENEMRTLLGDKS